MISCWFVRHGEAVQTWCWDHKWTAVQVWMPPRHIQDRVGMRHLWLWLKDYLLNFVLWNKKEKKHQKAEWMTHIPISMWFTIMQMTCLGSLNLPMSAADVVNTLSVSSDSAVEVVTTTSPGSLNKSCDLESCGVKRNVSKFTEYLRQTLNHSSLLAYSACQILQIL